MNPILLTDYYKTEHFRMYPEGTSLIYSNLTPRKSRLPGVDKVVVFGIQWMIIKYLMDAFNAQFFLRPWIAVEQEYKQAISTPIDHIKALHTLGYLPIRIKALPEGMRCPIRVPILTIVNTLPEFYWLTNYLETLMSAVLWQPMTSATIADQYKSILTKWAAHTGGDTGFIQWQGHDFSMRGMSSIESAIVSGMAHLTSFTGTDTISAIYELKEYYQASGLVGASVPATEHSVMCMGGQGEGEKATLLRHLKLYPTGILSEVMDTWDLWWVVDVLLRDPEVQSAVMAREGKLVIRPDSGDPVDIICGEPKENWTRDTKDIPKQKGVIELLWDIFGGVINQQGYKVLDPHIGAIYGDSITPERAEQICARLAAKGFCSTNIVFGIGSYTYQHNTRDTLGFAIKATYGEVNGVGREIYKDPKTDDGTKKSARGLVSIQVGPTGLVLHDQQTWEQEETGVLRTVFEDGRLVESTSLEEIRERLRS